MQLGCNCCESPISACDICCENGIAYVITATIPDGIFVSAGEFCTPCTDLDGFTANLTNFTVLHNCDWLFVDTTNVCGEGGTTSRSLGFGIRESAGICTATFRYGITCSGFVSFYDWQTTFASGSECDGILSLPYLGDPFGLDGTCCWIAGGAYVQPIEINLNP